MLSSSTRNRILVRTVLLAVFCLMMSNVVQAQESRDEIVRQRIIEQRIEIIAEGLEEGDELDFTTLFDDLNYYYDRKINLNRTTADELRSLYLLTEFQIQSLFNHIERYGSLKEIWELQALDRWDQYTILNLLPFVSVKPPSELERVTLKDIFRDGKHDLFLRYQDVLEERQGYAPISPEELAENPNRRYLGSSYRAYARYRFTYGRNISFGITAEKDPGEEFFQGTQKQGFDFYSSHLYYENNTFVRKALVGDYQLQFGQGLTLWSGLAFGKSADALNAKRTEIGIRPYTSVDENLFLRGAAVTVGSEELQFTAFYSANKIDANIVDTTATEQLNTISSFQLSGFHRTSNELVDKDAVTEQYFGGNFTYKTRRGQIGFTAVASEYDANVTRQLQLYNQFEFNDNNNQVLGLNYSRTIKNVNVFGEVSRSKNGAWATVNGALIALDPRVSMIAIHRSYARNFQNQLANTFVEGTRPANESGIYVGGQFKINRKWTATAYADFFRFQWLRFQTQAPSAGRDFLSQLNYKPSRNKEFYLRYRSRVKARNASFLENDITFPMPITQQNFRINTSFLAHPNIKLKSRAELVLFQQEGQKIERGFLLYQDLVFKKIQFPVSFSLRYALFYTDSYNARIYAYENDVLYAFSIPAYFSRGSRFYLTAKYKVARGVDLWLRYARWYYDDRQVISSGLEQINAPHRSEVKVQLRVRF